MFEIFIKCRKTGSVYQNDPSFETREHAVTWMMADWHTCASEVEDCRDYFEDRYCYVIREINTRAEQVAAYEAIRDCPVQQIPCALMREVKDRQYV